MFASNTGGSQRKPVDYLGPSRPSPLSRSTEFISSLTTSERDTHLTKVGRPMAVTVEGSSLRERVGSGWLVTVCNVDAHNDGQNPRQKVIHHFNVNEVHFRDINCFTHLHIAILCYRGNRADSRRYPDILLRMRCVGRDGWLNHATTEPGPTSLCHFPSSFTKSEILSQRVDLGWWIRLISFGWQVSWDNQWVLITGS